MDLFARGDFLRLRRIPLIMPSGGFVLGGSVCLSGDLFMWAGVIGVQLA